MVVQVRLVVDAGQGIPPRGRTGGCEQQQPPAGGQQCCNDAHEQDRVAGERAAHTVDDEHDEHDDESRGHAHSGPHAPWRSALGPVGLAAHTDVLLTAATEIKHASACHPRSIDVPDVYSSCSTSRV